MEPLKEEVRHFWDRSPCGTTEVALAEGSRPFFEALERNRYQGEQFIPDLVQFERWKDRTVLEIGCGAGVDLVRFARSGARIIGVDLSVHSLRLASRWLSLNGLPATVLQSDAETLPFKENSFDLIYSWGVLHHTPDTSRAIREAIRVCKPGGDLLVMLYNRRSLVALQVWLRFGLFRGRPFADLRRLLAQHMESPGTRAFTREEAGRLFSGMKEIHVQPVVTRFDLRLGQRRFLPKFLHHFVPSGLGWFLVIRARKP